MTWSPQARQAAILARRAKAHGKTKAPVLMRGHHGFKGGKTQPVSQHGHKGKKIAKVALASVAIGATGYGAYKAGSAQTKKAVSRKVRSDARKRLAVKGPQISGLKASRNLRARHPGDKQLHAHLSHWDNKDRATLKQINRYSKRTQNSQKTFVKNYGAKGTYR